MLGVIDGPVTFCEVEGVSVVYSVFDGRPVTVICGVEIVSVVFSVVDGSVIVVCGPNVV